MYIRLSMIIIILYIIIAGITVFFLPVTTKNVKKKLEKEGYRHIVQSDVVSLWETEYTVNHSFLCKRAKVRVFSCVGYTSIEVINLI